ncbi:MAG: UPF0175 family protein [Elusimicrobia bacterium]|nr:UPF0175 family protein [Elusimicrobiota bacterium]
MKNEVASARLDPAESKMVSLLAQLEGEDRSSIIRKLVRLGMETYRKNSAIKAYSQGKASLSKAAELMGVTVWEFLSELGRQGGKIHYDSQEFEKDLETIRTSF